MTTAEPSQPLTKEGLAAMREGYTMARSIPAKHLRQATRDAMRLLDEVGRLRAENAQLRRNAALVSDVTPKTTPTSGIVVNVEPPRGGSPANDFAIGYSAGLRNGRRGR